MDNAESSEQFNQDITYSSELYDYYKLNPINSGLFKDNKDLVYAPNVFGIDLYFMYSGCTNLKTIPKIDMPGVIINFSTFNGCNSLEHISGIKVQTFDSGIFQNKSSLKYIGKINGNVINAECFFENCISLKYIPSLFTSSPVFTGFIRGCNSLERIESISFINVESLDSSSLSRWGYLNNLKYMLIKDIGTPENANAIYLQLYPNWGAGSDENRQSLVDSLLTYSYDRTIAGYEPCTIIINSSNLALLTDNELASIRDKGYTIAV